MNKQQMIDKAIEDLDGNLPNGGYANYLIRSTPSNLHWGEGEYQMYSGVGPIGSNWQHICTRQEFEDRVEELNNMKKWNGEGFPPVGVDCEVFNLDKWVKTYIIGYDRDGYAVFDCQGTGINPYDGLSNEKRFRPIQSERDKVIEKAIMICSGVNIPHSTDGLTMKTLNSLYDAGMLKLPK